MRIHHIHIVFCVLVSAGLQTACRADVDYFPPDLIFFGTVRNAAGSGVRATVEVQQRDDCVSSNIRASNSAESRADGSYELKQEIVDLLRCFVVFALSTDVPLLQSDTIRIPGPELDELGDPLGTGRIPLDIEVR
jgi:hypothetical protein